VSLPTPNPDAARKSTILANIRYDRPAFLLHDLLEGCPRLCEDRFLGGISSADGAPRFPPEHLGNAGLKLVSLGTAKTHLRRAGLISSQHLPSTYRSVLFDPPLVFLFVSSRFHSITILSDSRLNLYFGHNISHKNRKVKH